MKGHLLAISLILLISIASSASNSESYSQEPTTSNTNYSPQVYNYSPQVCKFSLSSYTGKVDNLGRTHDFTVGLSCPQKEDVRATVTVLINNKRIASKIVTVEAGKDSSGREHIYVGDSYKGEEYELVVR